MATSVSYKERALVIHSFFCFLDFQDKSFEDDNVNLVVLLEFQLGAVYIALVKALLKGQLRKHCL